MDLKERILHRLAMKGLAEVDDLATEFEASQDDVGASLETLRDRGYVELELDQFWTITSDGESYINQQLKDRFTSEQIERLEAALPEFETLDDELKDLANEWQDASKKTSDEAIIDRLRDLHRRTKSFFGDFEEPIATEYRRYVDDLEHAFRRLEGGDEEYFTGAETESYHTVWFRLHDDLLRTLGKERDE